MSWSVASIAREPRLKAVYAKLSAKLKEIFQLEHADLDFGIYRILKLRKAELERFLDVELLPQVGAILSQQSAGMKATADSADGDDAVLTLAREVFADLLTFFSRYYDEGDFMSLPRYGKDQYAIPYDGSEVKLHWANADQYYVKSSEYFADYLAVLDDGVQGLAKPRLCFKLAAAESDRDNNKSSEKRRFVLRESEPVSVGGPGGDTLTAWFEWRAVGKDEADGKTTQDALNARTAETILAAVKAGSPWHVVLTRPRANSERTQLEYQLWRYTRKNTSDYFIHKDLGGFLRRELDFYIKNEVLLLDDLEGRGAEEIEAALRKVRALRQVAHKIITWLAQLEDFQKRLFLKKRFVLRKEVAACGPEWLTSLSLSVRQTGLSIAEAIVGAELVPSEPELDSELDGRRLPFYVLQGSSPSYAVATESAKLAVAGTLISGEALDALRLLEASYRGGMGAAYLDPPYNTGGDGFLYKDDYQHSSWLSMMQDRLCAVRSLIREDGAVGVSIDDNEQHRLSLLLRDVFGDTRYRANFVWQRRDTPANDSSGISVTHEYLALVPLSDKFSRGLFPRSAEQLEIYRNPDSDPRGPWTRTSLMVKNFVAGNDYGVLNPAGREVRPPPGMGWAWTAERMKQAADDNRLWWGQTGDGMPYQKRFLTEANDGVVPISWWDYKFASTNRNARQELRELFSGEVRFDTPKPTRLIERFLQVTQADTVLDCFAGSGTTGHALVNRARSSGEPSEVVLIESGDHFDTVLVPRILKATLASEWKDGKPVKLDPIKALHKIIYLESYDDTLENITLTRSDEVQTLLEGDAALREQYTLKYLLDLESRGSLLNLAKFTKPWSYTIKVRKDGVVQDSPVDLVETFNYLLGLHVKRYDTFGHEDLLFVEGTVKTAAGRDERVLVIWRDCEVWTDQALQPLLAKMLGTRQPDTRIYLDDYDTIYINGDHHLDLPKAGEEARLKVLPIEDTFHARMFDTSDDA